MSRTVDIHDLVVQLCERMGVEYQDTQYITIDPTMVEIAELRRNENGSFYIDRKTGKPARRVISKKRART